MKNVLLSGVNAIMVLAIALSLEGVQILDASLQWFLIGMVGYTMTHRLWFKNTKNYGFLAVFSHELNHAIIGMLCNLKITDLQVNKDGSGLVQYIGRTHLNIWFTLAPYCLPTATLVLLLPYGFLEFAYMNEYLILVGISYGFYVLTFLEQTRAYQTDLQEIGIRMSYLFILITNVLFILVITIIMRTGWEGIWDHMVCGVDLIVVGLKNLLTNNINL